MEMLGGLSRETLDLVKVLLRNRKSRLHQLPARPLLFLLRSPTRSPSPPCSFLSDPSLCHWKHASPPLPRAAVWFCTRLKQAQSDAERDAVRAEMKVGRPKGKGRSLLSASRASTFSFPFTPFLPCSRRQARKGSGFPRAFTWHPSSCTA